ncbi:adhesin [Pseudomonas alcaligenes]|uniref:Adhesin n=1 Tax=Aquipseudomonas alcaligenes TaxID=43263 RepID=A0ABR7S0H5_AQUAC|nr:DUF1302 domain-containing protein [Pseudomonas alcaligenes]MBC9250958.1 adhesin [Pseudomonas alcaligenes]
MTTTIRSGSFQPKVLTLAIALGIAAPAQAITFNIGEIEGQFDSALSIGASWSVRGPDSDFVAVANGGRASTRTADDGRLNFKQGETFSKIFKGIHDLELKYGDSGIFVRGKYWYDFELKDEHRLLYDIDDHDRKAAAQASGAQILDAFAYHNYTIGDLPGSVRLGKQVVSWGESTFIQNSINSINPVDVAAFRRPGAEIKEGLIPVNMLYLSQTLSDSLSVEGFYQLEWDQTVIDNCGTFFSTTDTVSDGCPNGLAINGSDFDRNSPAYLVVPRLGDRDARDSGQFGAALRWFVPELNDTEFGLYAMNIHSRLPVFSTVYSPATLGGYRIEYPEDIHLYGLSFQTNIASYAVSGELSYRPNQPLQINSPDLVFASLGLPFSPVLESGHAQPSQGADIPGYTREEVSQAQVTVLRFFDQVLGASRLNLIGEVGANYIGSISEGAAGKLRYGRDPIFGLGATSNSAICSLANPEQPDECNSHGYYTKSSWGYRARASLDYTNVIAGINLSPSVAWSHDVDGEGPNFTEGSKAVSLGLNADYQNAYTASLSYTDFFGGHYNTITDRDFVALSFGVTF